jgi:hypothetical protein
MRCEANPGKTDFMDPLKPNPALLCKLVSIAVHADEMLSPTGHHFDKAALQTVLDDADVKAWVRSMVEMGMAPVKR